MTIEQLIEDLTRHAEVLGKDAQVLADVEISTLRYGEVFISTQKREIDGSVVRGGYVILTTQE